MGKLTQSQKALFLWRNPISHSKKWFAYLYFFSKLK